MTTQRPRGKFHLEILNLCNMLLNFKKNESSYKEENNWRKWKDSGANCTIYSAEAIQRAYKQRRKLRAPSKTITRTCDQWLFKHFFNYLKCADADFKRLFFHFWLTIRHTPQKRSHLSVAILLLGIQLNWNELVWISLNWIGFEFKTCLGRKSIGIG